MDEGELQTNDVSISAARKSVEGNIGEGIAGIGVVALCIVGLAHVLPSVLLAIATIAAGLALMFEAATIIARYNPLVSTGMGRGDQTMRRAGTVIDFLAGAIGLALGVLALLGIVPMVLIPIAGFVFGTALMVNSSINARLGKLEFQNASEAGMDPRAIRGTDHTTAGMQILVGLGVITLSILSLTGIDPVILSLIGILSVGAVALTSSALLGGRAAYALRHSLHHR